MLQLIKKVFGKQQNVKEVIDAIHNEFNIGGETALKEAQEIIAGIHISNEKKSNRLKQVGFVNVAEVERTDKLLKHKRMQEDIAFALNELSLEYPQYKFITQEMAIKICEKYNLVLGDVKQYKGFVPDKNLKQVEVFYKNKELSTSYLECSRNWWNQKEISKEQYSEGLKQNEYYRTRNLSPVYNYISNNITLKIAAPLKDMNTEGYKLSNRIFTKEIPDPVILAPIKIKDIDLFCIVTAWGDEASDEIVVNQKMN